MRTLHDIRESAMRRKAVMPAPKSNEDVNVENENASDLTEHIYEIIGGMNDGSETR